MNYRTTAIFALCAAVLLLPASQARGDDFTIDLTPGWINQAQVESDYVQRGISQTGGRPSVDFTSGYTLSDGLYMSGTAIRSTVGEQGVEADWSGGWQTAITPSTNIQLAVIYQQYPFSGLHSANSVEFQTIANMTQSWGVIVAALAAQPQSQFHGGLQTYVSFGADYNLTNHLKLGGRIGYVTVENHAAQPNYGDWTITLTQDLGHNLSVVGQYTGLTYHCSDCGNRFVVLLTYRF